METSNTDTPVTSEKEFDKGKKDQSIKSSKTFKDDVASEKKNNEIEETADLRERSVHQLRELLKNEDSLNSRTDEYFLLCFLRARKFDCDRALALLKNYYGLRVKQPKIYEKCRPSEFLHAMETKVQLVLPKHDPLGRAIFLIHFGKLNASICSYEDQFRLTEFLFAIANKEEIVQKRGVVLIVDFKGFGFQQFKDIRFCHVKHFGNLVQNSFPTRVKGGHLIHEGYFSTIIYKILSPFLSDKIKRRVHFHGSNMESLHKYIDPSLLPEEYGGTLTDSELNKYEEEVLKNEDYFIEDAKYGFIS